MSHGYFYGYFFINIHVSLDWVVAHKNVPFLSTYLLKIVCTVIKTRFVEWDFQTRG